MNWFLKAANQVNALFSKYESDAQVAHFGWAAAILLGARLAGAPLWVAVLISATTGVIKQILVERIFAVHFHLVDPAYETWGHALRDTAMWMAGLAIALLIPKR